MNKIWTIAGKKFEFIEQPSHYPADTDGYLQSKEGGGDFDIHIRSHGPGKPQTYWYKPASLRGPFKNKRALLRALAKEIKGARKGGLKDE